MNDVDESQVPQRGWLERLSFALTGEPQDKEQLLELLRDASNRDLIDADALQMMEGVMDVSVMQVRDIMMPRSQMVVIEADDDLSRIVHTVTDSGHSRFPIIKKNRDEVIGLVLAKDLLKFLFKDDLTFSLEAILRPAMLVPESKRLDKLLEDFKRKQQHMAIVVDEYGGVSGLVTIEDILEQIVGDIEDEHDLDDETFILPQANNTFLIKALTPVENFNDYFDAHVDDSDFDTIGGIILHALGRMPKRGEIIAIDNYLFKIIQADSRQVHLLQMVNQQPATMTTKG